MENKELKLEKIRHSLAHVLAEAVKDMIPRVKFGVGPAIENGFYFDFDLPREITNEEIPEIESQMKKILKENQKFEQLFLSPKESREFLKNNNQKYTLELLEEIIKQYPNQKVSFYKSGRHKNMCIGPHVNSTKEIPINAFKITNIAGAYWKGDEKNKMLTRIYGVAFLTKEELDVYLENQEKLKRNDHRILGKKLDLFCFSKLVGPGLPLFTPKGTAIKEEVQKYIEEICREYGFEKVMTPHIAKIKLFELSGHATKFPEELLHVSSERYSGLVLKPVQCPAQTQIYASKPRSYKDLPIRYMESDKQYRGEKPGEVSGLSRVLAITVEDGHSFCRVDQVKDEVKMLVNVVEKFYRTLGLWEKKWVSLSVRDCNHPEKYIGEAKDWEICENMLQEVSDEMNLNAQKREGEAAVYGPKLDFMFKDALGREIQIPTIQVDFASPKRFRLEYTDEKGKIVTPVMVHRAILGSYERLLVLLIEHFGGKFPVWLSPIQIKIIPVSKETNGYAQSILKKLENENIRVEEDLENNSMGAKIRKAQEMKTPYMLIVGKKEQENKSVSVRLRDGQNLGEMKISDFKKRIKKEIKKRELWEDCKI